MKSFFPYLGGKSKLAAEIVTHFPDHTCYVEVFTGAGHVFFHKERSKVEVLNDINSELMSLYRVVKNHPTEFLKEFELVLVSRQEFQDRKDTPPHVLTDVQRAARFYYLLKTSFAGKVDNPTFGYAPSSPPRLNLGTLGDQIMAVYARLHSLLS